MLVQKGLVGVNVIEGEYRRTYTKEVRDRLGRLAGWSRIRTMCTR